MSAPARASHTVFERPPGGRVLSVRGYGARPRTGRHASGLRSGCGGAARGRGGDRGQHAPLGAFWSYILPAAGVAKAPDLQENKRGGFCEFFPSSTHVRSGWLPPLGRFVLSSPSTLPLGRLLCAAHQPLEVHPDGEVLPYLRRGHQPNRGRGRRRATSSSPLDSIDHTY